MSNRERRLEEAEELLARLREEKIPIIVEGIRDEKALRSLGVTSEMHRIQGLGPGSAVAKVAERLKRKGERSAIILTDPDKEGAKIARTVASALEDFGMHPVMRYRKMTKLFGKAAVEQLAARDGE